MMLRLLSSPKENHLSRPMLELLVSKLLNCTLSEDLCHSCYTSVNSIVQSNPGNKFFDSLLTHPMFSKVPGLSKYMHMFTYFALSNVKETDPSFEFAKQCLSEFTFSFELVDD